MPTDPPQMLQKTPVPMGVALGTFEDGLRAATLFAKSELVPKHLRGKPEDVFVTMQYGAELGLTPMQAVQGIKVINSVPGVYGETALAVVMASPHYEEHDEFYEVAGKRRETLTNDDLKADTTTGVCVMRRRGKINPVVVRFSVADAQRANLWKKAGPWTEYPQRMLRMRARGFVMKDLFPDVLKGIHTVEELQDLPVVDVAPEPATVHRLSERPQETPAPPVDPEPLPVVDRGPRMVLGPLPVLSVERLLGGARVTLGDGRQVWAPGEADAKELGKFAGTAHPLLLTVEHDAPDTWQLVSFEIAQ